MALQPGVVSAYLQSLFGYEKAYIESTTDSDFLRSIHSPEEFASLLFWTELRSVAQRELKPDIDEMYRRIVATPDAEVVEASDWKRYRARNENRLFSLEYFGHGFWQRIVRVHELPPSRIP